MAGQAVPSCRWPFFGPALSTSFRLPFRIKKSVNQPSDGTQVPPFCFADKHLDRQNGCAENIKSQLLPGAGMPPHEQKPVARFMTGILLAVSLTKRMADLVVSHCLRNIHGLI